MVAKFGEPYTAVSSVCNNAHPNRLARDAVICAMSTGGANVGTGGACFAGCGAGWAGSAAGLPDGEAVPAACQVAAGSALATTEAPTRPSTITATTATIAMILVRTN